MIWDIITWVLIIWIAQAVVMAVWVYFENDPKFGRFNLGTAVAVLIFGLMMPHMNFMVMWESVAGYVKGGDKDVK